MKHKGAGEEEFLIKWFPVFSAFSVGVHVCARVCVCVLELRVHALHVLRAF